MSEIAVGSSAWAIRSVWMRYFDVYRKNIKYALLTTLGEPILYLVSFGYGLGGLIGTVNLDGTQLTYRQFVFAGIVAQAVLFQGFFEAAYGSFIRMHYQKIFKAMALTPITMSEVLWGELLWDASKATFSASVVLLIGCLTRDFSIVGSLLAIPVCFISALIFSGLGLWCSSKSETIDQINYPQYLLVFPMFLYCGVYFPIQQLPKYLQLVAWFFPLTSVASLARTLTLGVPFYHRTIPLILGWALLLVVFSRRAMTRRLIK